MTMISINIHWCWHAQVQVGRIIPRPRPTTDQLTRRAARGENLECRKLRPTGYGARVGGIDSLRM